MKCPDKSVEAGQALLSGRGEKCGMTTNENRISPWGDESVLELGSGENCMSRISQKSLNYIHPEG